MPTPDRATIGAKLKESSVFALAHHLPGLAVIFADVASFCANFPIGEKNN
jgi:hypothetical protein